MGWNETGNRVANSSRISCPDMENRAKIVVSRQKEWFNRSRSFRIWIDGIESDIIGDGGTISFWVAPGDHKIQCRLAWYGSQEIRMHLAPGETNWFKVRNGMKYYWHSFVVLLIGIVLNLTAVGQDDERPLWAPLIELILILPALFYMLYYMTLGRKKYLILEEDKERALVS